MVYKIEDKVVKEGNASVVLIFLCTNIPKHIAVEIMF